MRPYLAILKDSFREALASRVLWVLLVLILLTLAALAPFGAHSTLTSSLNEGDVSDWPGLAKQLQRAAEDDAPSPGGHILSLLDDNVWATLRKLERPEDRRDPSQVIQYQRQLNVIREEFNDLLQRQDFYNAEAWQGRRLSIEARRLLLSDEPLDDRQIRRVNRLALEAAFPEFIAPSPEKSLLITYAGMEVGVPLPFTREQLSEELQPLILLALDWIVGPVGVFVAVLSTASLIPHTLAPGSLNLLLSKPISRSGLLLTKFLGGCCFILICGAILFTGIWLILGLRLGIWNHKLLLYIPIYLFLFTIYYSVSTMAGLVWRNTIMAVAASVAFWALCFGVGTAKTSLEWLTIDRLRIIQVMEAGDDLIAVDQSHVPRRWSVERNLWEEVFLAEPQREVRGRPLGTLMQLPRVIGPVYDQAQDRLIAVQRAFHGRPLSVWAGAGEQNWRRAGGAPAPGDVVSLMTTPQGEIIAATRQSVFRMKGDPATESERPKVFGVELPFGSSSAFRQVADDAAWERSRHPGVAINRATGDLAVYSAGAVVRLTPTTKDNRLFYEKAGERRLTDDRDRQAVAAYGKNVILVVDSDGTATLLDGKTLEIEETLTPVTSSPPRFAASSPDGEWLAVVYHNGRLWMYDVQEERGLFPSVTGQGDISAVAFSREDGEILVVDRGTRLSRYQLGDFSRIERVAPPMDLTQAVYRWAVLPIYTVFPKPGELYKTTQYLLTGKTTQTLADPDKSLAEPQQPLRPWAPVYSGLGFVLVMLLVCCVYFERQEY